MNSSIYLDSLEFKLKSAKYHCNQTISSIYNKVVENKEEQLVAVSSEFTAMMLSFQSSLDVLAQWLNSILKLDLDVNELYFNTLFKNKAIANYELRKMLLDIKRNDTTKYLRSYCNIGKHSNIIKLNEQPELYPSKYLFPSENLFPGRQFVIDKFIDKFNSYDERNIISQSEVTFSFFNKMIRRIVEFVQDNINSLIKKDYQ